MKEKVTLIQRPGKKSVQKESVLHIYPQGDTRKEQKLYIEDFAEDMYDFLREREEMEGASPTMTAAFATAVSRCFQFEGFSSQEVKLILYRDADRLRKDARKKIKKIISERNSF